GDRLVATLHRIDRRFDDQPGFPFNAGEHRPAAFAFSPDNRLFAAVYGSGKLGVWDSFTGEEVLSAETACPSPKFVAFAPDGRTVFTASGEGAGGPVYGFDTTGSSATADLGGPPANARKAIYALAAKPAEALKAAVSIASPTTD